MATSTPPPSAAPAPQAAPVDPAWHGLGPLDSDVRDDPYPTLERIRREAPVHVTPDGRFRVFLYEDALRVLRELPTGVRRSDGRLPEYLGASETEGNFMLQRDPPDHTRLRKLVSKAFTPRAIERWRPRTRAIAAELMAEAAERGSMDAIAELALPPPSRVICEMLGVPLADHARFTQWTADATHRLAGTLAAPEMQARALASTGELAVYFQALIEERRARPGDDLLSAMIRARDEDDALTPDELLVQAIGLLIAGFETTIGLIGLGLRSLIQHPAELERLRRDPSLAATAVDECLRFDGPIPLTPRVMHADAELRGVSLPKDADVWVYLCSANRDPAHFAAPERFDIGRTPNSHLAFGGGAHFCLGAHLARMEGQEAFSAVVRHADALELESDRVEWGVSLFRVPARLPLRLRPRREVASSAPRLRG